jgi:hypothetical protein
MATRIQLRRGTATQWTTADPILEAGEVGWESDTNKFKIGDGINNWDDLTYFLDATDTGFNAEDYILATSKNAVSGVAALDANINVVTTTGVVFEGATANEYELTLAIAAEPTADRTITLPDATGTVQLRVADVSDEEIAHLNGVTSGIQTQLDARVEESLFDAKGDLLVGSADNTPTKLTVGTNGYILTANSSATNGIEWAAAPAGYSPPTLGSTQIASGATVTTIAGLTLSTPTVSGLAISDSSIVFEGTTADEYETTLTVGDPTADRTITLPDATGTVALLTATQTFTNSKLTGSSYESNIVDPTIIGPLKLEGGAYGVTIASSGDRENFKTWSFGTDGVLSAPGNIIFEGATANDYETTLAITDPTADRTITLPDVTGTVVTTGNLSSITSVGTLASLTVTGDLTVNGTTTTINSTTLTVDDKNIVLGDVETPTDTTADGGGITLKGATDKTFNWVDATDAWTSSEHMNLLTGKSYKINGTAISAALPALTWGEVKDGKSGLTIS